MVAAVNPVLAVVQAGAVDRAKPVDPDLVLQEARALGVGIHLAYWRAKEMPRL